MKKITFTSILIGITLLAAVCTYMCYQRKSTWSYNASRYTIKQLNSPLEDRVTQKVHTVPHNTSPYTDYRLIRSYKDLHHPKSPQQLWVQINKGFIIRRLAYHDTRDRLHDTAVRFLAMYDRRQDDPPKPLHVKLHYSDGTSSHCIETNYQPGFLKGADVYVLYLMSVTVPSSYYYERKIFSHASIHTDVKCISNEGSVSIQTTEFKGKEERLTYGVCLHKALLDNIQPQVLLDWVKLNIALGAQIITVYLQEVRESMYTILKPYIDRGIVDVIDWKLEPPLTNSRSSSQGQTGVISECIWYNMNRVQYLGLYDLDEFIVPQKHHTVQDMIKEVETRQSTQSNGKLPAGSFLLWNANMYDNGKPILNVEEASKKCPQFVADSELPVYFKRSQSCLVQKEAKMKMIAKTNAAYTAWGHCLITFREKEYSKEYIVPPTLGQSFHYRPTWKEYEGCTSMRRNQPAINRYFSNVTNCTI